MDQLGAYTFDHGSQILGVHLKAPLGDLPCSDINREAVRYCLQFREVPAAIKPFGPKAPRNGGAEQVTGGVLLITQ